MQTPRSQLSPATDTDSPADPEPTPDRIFRIFRGYQLTAALKAAISLGVFDQIAAGKSDVATIAAGIGAHERGTALLLDALTALALLDRKGGDYQLAPDVDAFLVSARPGYIGDTVDVFVSPWHWDRFGRLADAVRAGGSVFEEDAETAEHPFWQVFATAYQRASLPTAETIADLLAPWASARQPLELLDVACGGGLFSIALGRRNHQARLTMLDAPSVLAITRHAIDDAGLSDRARYLPGDMFDMALAGPYDAVLASRVFHHFSQERCITLLRRLRDVLKPDGRIAIHDFVTHATSPADEPAPHLFSLIMLVWTRGGRSHSIADYERMLAAAGFGEPVVHDLPATPTRLLIAERND